MSDYKISVAYYFGDPAALICDAKCHKAWGISGRPRVQLSDDDDDYAYLSDGELGQAPDDPGTYEGLEMEGKPPEPQHNRWCWRECERSSMFYGQSDRLVLRNFAKRVYNMPSRHDPR